jgi:hypothetical protein
MTSPDDNSGPWVALEAIVATTHRVEKYGGVQLAESALQQIVDALNAGTLPMIGHHDWTKPIRTRDLEASIVELTDGEKGVRLVGLVHQDDWDAAGQIGGMSFTTFDVFGTAEGPHPPGTEPVKLAADAGWFTDEDIGAACSVISQLAPAEGARLLQFSAVDIARITFEIGITYVTAWGPGIAQNAIWDGLKHLMLRRLKRTPEGGIEPPTRIELVTPLPAGAVTAIIDTSDPDVAQKALAVYSDAVVRAAQSAPQVKHIIVWRDRGDGASWEHLQQDG